MQWVAMATRFGRSLTELAWPHGGQRSARRNALRAVLADTHRGLERASARQALDAASARALGAEPEEALAAR